MLGKCTFGCKYNQFLLTKVCVEFIGNFSDITVNYTCILTVAFMLAYKMDMQLLFILYNFLYFVAD